MLPTRILFHRSTRPEIPGHIRSSWLSHQRNRFYYCAPESSCDDKFPLLKSLFGWGTRICLAVQALPVIGSLPVGLMTMFRSW